MITVNAIKVEPETGYTTDILVDSKKRYLEEALKDVEFAITRNGANEIIIVVTRGKNG